MMPNVNPNQDEDDEVEERMWVRYGLYPPQGEGWYEAIEEIRQQVRQERDEGERR